MWVGSMIVDGEVGAAFFDFGLEVLSPGGAVMTMTLVCCIDETLF
jgi:hypothetical protein